VKKRILIARSDRKNSQNGHGAHAGARIIRRPGKSARIAQDLLAILLQAVCGNNVTAPLNFNECRRS